MKVNINRNVSNLAGVLFLVLLMLLLTFDVLRRGIYTSKLGMNIAIVGNNSVAIMLLRPEEDLISWVDLPSNLKIDIFQSSATYPISSLWKYGSLEKKPFEIFEQSLGTTMGVTVPRVIKVNGEANIETVLGNLHKIGLKTDVSLRDRILIRKFVADSVESKKVIEEIIPKKAFNEVVEPDGKVFLVVNSIASLWTNSKFILEPILSENTDVTVNNLTGVSGYGVDVSKQIESVGIRVVGVKADTSDSVVGDGCIFSGPIQFPISEKFLTDQLNCRRVFTGKEESQKGITVWLK